MNYRSAQIQIGNKSVDCFRTEDGNYLFSQTSTAELIEKIERSAREYFKSKGFKTRYSKDFQPAIYQVDNIKFTLVDNEAVFLYLMNAFSKGNELAGEIIRLLMSESLEIRAKVAFGDVADAAVMATQRATDEELATRERRAARQEHGLFQQACLNLGYSPKAVHEYITKIVFGKTAKEACEQPLPPYEDEVWSNPTIGINHHADPFLHQIYRDVKKAAMSYRKGGYQERVERAYVEVTNHLPLG